MARFGVAGTTKSPSNENAPLYNLQPNGTAPIAVSQRNIQER